MGTYFVMAPSDMKDPVASPHEADRLEFLPDRFSWAAFFFSLAWLIWHRMWLVLLAVVVGLVATEAAATLAHEAAPAFALVAFLLLFGFEANGLRRWTMERQGWKCLGLACGDDQTEAELRFFNSLQSGTPELPEEKAPAPIVRRTGIVPRIGTDRVVGMKLGQETNR